MDTKWQDTQITVITINVKKTKICQLNQNYIDNSDIDSPEMIDGPDMIDG